MADKDLEEIRKLCFTKIGICADNVLKYLENDKEEEFAKLRSHLKHYCLYEEYPNVIEQVSENIKNKLHASNLNGIEDRFHKCFNSMVNKIDVENHPWIIELDKKIQKGDGIAGNLDMMDPLTKKPIQNPVMNKHCRHIYEKESILNHINFRKKATLCPWLGCGNKQPLQPVDLLSNIDTGCILNQPSTSNGVPVYDVDMDSE